MILHQGHKGNQLFPDCQMIRREIPSQREFEQKFSSELRVIGEIITKSFEMLKCDCQGKAPQFRDKNFHPVVMSGNIKGFLIEHYGGLVKIKGGRFFLSLNGKIIFFKKIDNTTKLPSHNETANSKKLVSHLATLFEIPDPIIWIGYCVDDSWTNLLGYYAESIVDGKINWITNLSDYESDQPVISYITPHSPEKDSEKLPLVSIKAELKKAK